MKEAVFSSDFPVFFFWVSVYTCQASKSRGTWFVSAKLFQNLKFIEKRRKFYAVSLAVIITGLGFALIRGFNYGIDFTGGTMMQIELGQEATIDEVKEAIADYDLDPTIVYATDNNSQIIIRTIKDLKSAERTEVINTLADKYGFDTKEDVLASEEFGPTVGRDLRQNAIKSILIAAAVLLIYI